MKRRALLGTTAAMGLGGPARAATPGEVLPGQMLRDARMQGVNGPSRSLLSYRGRPLIINVWASWCGPCRAEMPSLERLAWSEMGSRFAVIGISTDDRIDAALSWLRQSNATLNHYLDRALELENMLGASHLPLTVLVDAQGRLLDKVAGAKEWDGAEAGRLIARTFGLRDRPPAGRAAATRSGNAATR